MKGLEKWRIKNGGECEWLEGTRRKLSRVSNFRNPCETPTELGDLAKLHCEI